MTPAWKEGQTVVSRLRVHSRGLDPLSTRLRVESLLGAARIHPAGLAPSALLIIRRFRDPLPGTFSLRRTSLRPPIAWERAAEEALRDLARRAIRPASGPAEVDAEAVLFTDRAEFLACLTRDWLESRMESRWWWRSILSGLAPSGSIAKAWISEPEYIPAALQHLAVNGLATSFVKTLRDDLALDLTLEIARSHDLASIRSAILLPPDLPVRVSGSLPRVLSDATPPAPWAEQVPEASDRYLGMEQRTLLGLGLTLRRSPGLARRPSSRWKFGPGAMPRSPRIEDRRSPRPSSD